MRLEDLDRVRSLKQTLASANEIVKAFEAAPGATVEVLALTSHRDFEVNLLPVDKAVAISAAQCEREKIVDQLRALGVTLD